ncbi:MAG: hypothetical protein ACI9G1_000730 [Pirellulaceae bacterium]|jgi:hypothetical protein
MSRRKRVVPKDLEKLKQRFVAWRASRRLGERIPSPLWRAATKLAVKHGLHSVAGTLRLDYYELKKRVDSLAGDRDGEESTEFVELPSPAFLPAAECLIELEDAAGSTMRITVKGHGIPDLPTFTSQFWNRD